jgi:hypothetical protein
MPSSKLMGGSDSGTARMGIVGFAFADLQDAYGGCELVQPWLLSRFRGH